MNGVKAFFDFMNEREHVRLRKAAGQPWPWTKDKILQEYSFTNVKRLHDRTTQHFKDIYDVHRDEPLDVILFNCALYRYFGTAEFADAVGWHEEWTKRISKEVQGIARDRRDAGLIVYTGAYIIPTLGRGGPKHEVICDHILTPLWNERARIIAAARDNRRWEEAAKAMYELPGFGGSGFMTKEVLQDAMLTPVLEDAADRTTWSPAGPGARRGLNRVHGRDVDAPMKEDQAVVWMCNLLAEAPLYFVHKHLTLELHDIQFQLCEFDKHERVRKGEGKPRKKYHRPQ